MSHDDPFQAPSEPFDASLQAELKHSGLGIAAFTLGILSGLIGLGAVAAGSFLEASMPGAIDDDSVAAILIVMAAFGGLSLGTLAVGLGIGALFQKRKKVFAALGVASGLLVVLAFAGLFALSIMMVE